MPLYVHSCPELPPPPNPQIADELCLALQTDEALAARVLYRRYAAGVRFHLRRTQPVIPIDNIVLSVLIDASRRLRSTGPPTVEQITSTVLECTRAAAAQLPSQPEWNAVVQAGLNLQKRSELVNALFTSLKPEEREILLRAFLLDRSDDEISQEMSIPVDTVRDVRTSARNRFRRMSANTKIN